MNPSVIRAMILLRLRRVLRDRAGLVWLLVMPMVFSFIMGQLLGDWSDAQGQPRKPRFMVYAGRRRPAVDRLLAPLIDHEAFLLVRADTLVTPEAARAAVDDGRITAALLVPAGIRRAAAGRRSATPWPSGTTRTGSAARPCARPWTGPCCATTPRRPRAPWWPRPAPDGSVPRRQRPCLRPGGLPAPLGPAAADPGRRDPGPPARARDLRPDRARPSTTGPSYTLFFVMMFLMMSAKDLVTERQDRTLARLMVSRATALDLVLGFFLGGMALGLLQAAILLVLNSLAFGIDYGDSPLGLALTVLLFAGVSSAGSVLLGSVARTGGQADGLGMAVTMVMAAVGGLWWPLEVVPASCRRPGRALPTGPGHHHLPRHDRPGLGPGRSCRGCWPAWPPGSWSCWCWRSGACAGWWRRPESAADGLLGLEADVVAAARLAAQLDLAVGLLAALEVGRPAGWARALADWGVMMIRAWTLALGTPGTTRAKSRMNSAGLWVIRVRFA